MPDLQTRTFEVRAVDTQTREVTGIAVPWDTEIAVWGYRESIAPGACEPIDNPKYFNEHRQPIGRLTAWTDTPEGWQITARISETPAGDEAYTLVRDGVIDRMSIGFEPIEQVETVADDGTVSVRRTRIRIYEVSLVAFPAYDGAAVTDVRSAPTHQEDPVPDTLTRSDLDPLNEQLDEMRRSLLTLAQERTQPTAPSQYRTAGHLLKALVAGDEAAVAEYNATIKRDYTGAVLNDGSPRPAWVGDLTRLVDEAAILASLFETGPLPAEGNTIEYAQLKTNTVAVGKQAAEGDTLTFGKVSTEIKNATVETYGGYSTLSRQSIERSSVNLLNHTLNALGIAAGKARNTAFRTHYAAAVATQITAGNTVTVADGDVWADWLDAVVDAAEVYTDLGLALEALVVDKTIFKRMARMTGTDGRPVMTVVGTGVNVVGSIDVKAIQGDFASVPVRLNPKQSTPGAAFVNRLAIRAYNSPVTQLQDETIANLTKDFGVYFYTALANEIPGAIVPVTITA